MSMALALEFTTEWLRSKHGWKPNECGVQFEAQPAYDAGQFYVALDDSGVETGPDETDSLKEILTITIGVWRRPEHLMKDKRGILKLPHDQYLLGAWTLHELERSVIVHKTGGSTQVNKDGLHNNWSFMSELNSRYNLPNAEYGAKFTQPLRYKGKGRMVTTTVGGEPNSEIQAWYGYLLRFRGLYREQKMRDNLDAIG